MLSIARSGLSYKPKPENALNLKLMDMIDKEYTKHPFRGTASMTTWLREDKGIRVNHKRVERLYKLMCIQAIAPGPLPQKGTKGIKSTPTCPEG
ncbi:IS3 family transposase [Flammeovirgaceae bacterium SG7u.111]|nr:IS3 family transposase [Flammeovirgaceae bacterium SG7u.132]WPO33699.1 IS3 family transposase [Flammeovirgaceae bacterium SG7u.111]